jgi:hypothetical protein
VLAGAAMLALCWLGNGSRADNKTGLTAEMVRALQTKYQEERDKAVASKLAEKFSPQALQKAEQFAKRGATALAAGRLVEASDAFREARWMLPAASTDLPEHLARVFGNPRMRHAERIDDLSYNGDGSRLATISRDG